MCQLVQVLGEYKTINKAHTEFKQSNYSSFPKWELTWISTHIHFIQSMEIFLGFLLWDYLLLLLLFLFFWHGYWIERTGAMTYLAVWLPQASMKLSPPRRSSSLTPPGLPLPPHQSLPERGLPALVDCTTGVIVYSHVDKNVGDIVLHGWRHPPVLLCEMSVVCDGLVYLLLLHTEGVDAAWKLWDPRSQTVRTCRP